MSDLSRGHDVFNRGVQRFRRAVPPAQVAIQAQS